MMNVLSMYYHFILRERSVIILGGNIENARIDENKLIKRVHFVYGSQVVCKFEKVQINNARDVYCII